MQINFLFILSLFFIAALWIYFHIEQNRVNRQNDIERYSKNIDFLEYYIMQLDSLSDQNLRPLGLKIYKKGIPKKYKIFYKYGNNIRGLKVLKFDGIKVLNIYNPFINVYLQDIHKKNGHKIINLIFIFLLFSQIALYIKLRVSLKSLSFIREKLETINDGDLSTINFDTKYRETGLMVTLYNRAITRVVYLLNIREMFNKIFMHEIKMPIAKGMFYLKQEPSQKNSENLQNIFYEINNELDKFYALEDMLINKNIKNIKQSSVSEILDSALNKFHSSSRERVNTKNIDNYYLVGNFTLWVLCFKNMIQNGLNYSLDRKISIEVDDDKVIFTNLGEELPIDLNSEIIDWKIEKEKRHKSSTGYGFGLFIIQTIVNLNGYKLNYIHEDGVIKLIIHR